MLAIRSCKASKRRRVEAHTLDGVGLGELREVRHEVLGQVVPCLALLHAKVDVCARQLINVKLKQRVSSHLAPDARVVRVKHGIVPCVSSFVSFTAIRDGAQHPTSWAGAHTRHLPPSRTLSSPHLFRV